MSARTVVLCGVGGQGTVLAADLLARAAMKAGLQVKVSEIHGMAQRGGAVTTVVRFGAHVGTMLADAGSADFVVSFETTEALRNVSALRRGGYLLVADETIKPLPVACGQARMPHQARRRLQEMGADLVPASSLAAEAGSPKSVNVVLLGALESRLGLGEDVWRDAIASRVPPRTVEANLDAFARGLAFARAAAAQR
ncbi:indolepyruvate oxidoreductase subunit beta [Eggerthellaceae bacterium zg-1084]|uniref:Indolepyruvate oxidoreductase subunit beta n=1 Tax=Berryella wangjianweii TaxID=2734634 RepID=A0A6M8J074_9ACTN|nr:indolepyruvate oxidoreductase subunit beta [Berryella wangjianweii]NPD30277.1 indolepyruvate oxidoreductase subunit beta [Berryella wangjianweii]NPD32580.1 indolepyruvate oxidoreductase subunit beta [Eggerthellaceae bacterium zg-997]QKF06964.1 indolepyruvate oxidoreductase subunit beta [Berryella wangjianweii]